MQSSHERLLIITPFLKWGFGIGEKWVDDGFAMKPKLLHCWMTRWVMYNITKVSSHGITLSLVARDNDEL